MGRRGVTFVFLFLVTLSDLSSLDRHWLPGLESSGWLARVRSCLLVAKEVTSTIFLKRRCAMLLGGWRGVVGGVERCGVRVVSQARPTSAREGRVW